MLKKLIITGGLVGMLSVTASVSVFALDDSDRSGSSRDQLQNRVKSEVTEVEREVETESERVNDRVKEQVIAQQEQVEDRKSELKASLEQMRAERKEKLEGRRLAMCQNRQDSINALISKSKDNGMTHLANIQRVEAGVRNFVDKKQLSSDAITAAGDIVDQKEAAAKDALAVLEQQSFSCDSVNAAKPTGELKAIREAKQSALREYRASVVDYIKVVKAAFVASVQASEPEQTEESAQ